MLIKDLRPIGILLRLCGFFLSTETLVIRWVLILITVSLISINFALFVYNVIAINYFRKLFGLMNEMTISLLIQGLKPLHAMVNLTVFLCNLNVHREAVKIFKDIDYDFDRTFRYKIQFKYKFAHMAALVCLLFMVPLGIRVSAITLMKERLGTSLMGVLSLILVPMLSVWQMLPLYYYYVTTSVLTYWFNFLNSKVKSNSKFVAESDTDQNDNQQSFKEYLAIFQKLTKAVFVLDTFFNPFVFFSMGMSLTVLCITIYYITAVSDLVSTSKGAMYGNTINTYYFVIWTGLQVLAAVAYIMVICSSGWNTNESARRISSALLSTVPRTTEMKFQMDQIMHKIYTQFGWGISVWRITLVERSLLLTTASGIVTYAMILLKLQSSDCNCPQIATNLTS